MSGIDLVALEKLLRTTDEEAKETSRAVHDALRVKKNAVQCDRDAQEGDSSEIQQKHWACREKIKRVHDRLKESTNKLQRTFDQHLPLDSNILHDVLNEIDSREIREAINDWDTIRRMEQEWCRTREDTDQQVKKLEKAKQKSQEAEEQSGANMERLNSLFSTLKQTRRLLNVDEARDAVTIVWAVISTLSQFEEQFLVVNKEDEAWYLLKLFLTAQTYSEGIVGGILFGGFVHYRYHTDRFAEERRSLVIAERRVELITEKRQALSRTNSTPITLSTQMDSATKCFEDAKIHYEMTLSSFRRDAGLEIRTPMHETETHTRRQAAQLLANPEEKRKKEDMRRKEQRQERVDKIRNAESPAELDTQAIDSRQTSTKLSSIYGNLFESSPPNLSLSPCGLRWPSDPFRPFRENVSSLFPSVSLSSTPPSEKLPSTLSCSSLPPVLRNKNLSPVRDHVIKENMDGDIPPVHTPVNKRKRDDSTHSVKRAKGSTEEVARTEAESTTRGASTMGVASTTEGAPTTRGVLTMGSVPTTEGVPTTRGVPTNTMADVDVDDIMSYYLGDIRK
jgi:hypothetical protein